MLPCGDLSSLGHQPRLRRGIFPSRLCTSISSLLVAPDVADDVGNVLVTFFLVGNDGRIFIITIIIFDGLVDIVLGLGNDSLHLAGILLGVGLLERYQLLGLHRLWRDFCFWHGSSAHGAAAITRRLNRSDRHDLAGIGRDHRILVQIVKLLARGRTNAFCSEFGFGHVRNSWNRLKKRRFTWLVRAWLSRKHS